MPADERIAARSQSFGAVADGYDRYRPGPPAAALDWLIPATARDVIELGAGTGAVTRPLQARGLQVRAVEPDARMRAHLVEHAVGAEILDGTGEAIPAGDASADLVIAGSSWHWVDEERGVPEVARVLRPGGRFAVLWNGADRTEPWLRAVWAGGVAPDEAVAEQQAQRSRWRKVDLGASTAFSEPEQHLVRWSRTMSRDELVGMIGTYSVVIIMAEDERQRHLAGAVAFLDTDPATAGRQSFEVPMGCVCWRAERMEAS